MLLELWPVSQQLSPAPDEAAHASWAAHMRMQPGPCCLLPFEDSPSVRAFAPIARFMALTKLHGRPLVNGYSSFYPEEHERLWRSQPRLGDANTDATLRAVGVHEVVSYARLDAGDWPLTFRDDALGIRVYLLP